MEPIRLSALGRNVSVGDFYNYYNDRILPGAIRVLRHSVDISRTCEVESAFFFQQPDKFKRHMLKINSHLDQSIEGGSMGFERLWFAGYLEPTPNEDVNTAQVDVIFRITRRTEVLIPQYFDQPKMTEYRHTTGGMASHVVEKVFYGAELIISMRRPLDSQFESKASAEGNLYVAAKAYFETIVQNGSIEMPIELASIRCTIFSSINAGNVRNGTVEDSCKLLRDVINSTNEEKWQPMEIILKHIPEQIEARLWSEKMNDVEFEMERQLAMLKTIVKESNVISKYPSIDRVPPLEKAICQFLDLLTPLPKKINNSHSQFFMNMEPPQQILVEMKSISNLLTEMTDWLAHRRKEVEIMCRILSGTTLPMSDLEEIKNYVSSGKQKRTRAFILKMDYAQDQLIDRLAQLIGSQEPFKIPVFWVAQSGKHWIGHIVELLKSFEEISTLPASMSNSYQIGLVPISSSLEDGDVIPIEISVNNLPEIPATESPGSPIQPFHNSQEEQFPSLSSNSTLFPPVKIPLAPTVYNQQLLRTAQRMTSSVKQLGPIKSAHPSIEEDYITKKDTYRKEPVMAIPSVRRDDQFQNNYSESSLSLLNNVKECEEHATCTPPIPSPTYVRKKSFELKKEHDSMKQAVKQDPLADVQIERDVKEQNLPVDASIEKATPSIQPDPSVQEHLASSRQASAVHEQIERDVIEPSEAKEKRQATQKHDQFSPVANCFGNSTEKWHVTGFDTLSEAISRFEPDPPVQESPTTHQHIQQASAIHQQDLDRQETEVQNQEQNCPKGTDSSRVSAKIGRVAEIFAQETNQFAKLIKQGQPNVYLLNAKEISISEDFRWFEIDHHGASATPEVHREHKIIILMGATGCGKSTLINGMVNYILGVKWNDPFRFKCVRDDETTAKNQAHSQTSSVTAYTLRHHNGMAVPYSITIIDTPGYGDTRGMDRDRLITRNIHQFLTQQGDNRVDQIHAACFVAASGDSRLTATQSYIIASVLSIFGKDVKENMRLLVTFADNADPPVVEACLAANFPVTSASAGIGYSKFNSSVLYATNQNHGDFCFDELFWDMGQENFDKFFTMLEGMNGRNLKSTREVIQRRQQLEQSLKDIETELEGALSTIEDMEKIRQKLRVYGNKIKDNKNFVMEKTEVRNVEVKCEKGFSAYNCKRCQKTCEKPAKIKEKEFEKKMCTDSHCNCPASAHVYQQFSWLKTTVKITTTLLDMKAEYESNYNRKLKTEDIMASCVDDLNMAKGKVLSLLEQVGANTKSLDSTALRSNALNPGEYLSLMKSRVLEEQKTGYLTRLQTLTEIQQSLNAPAVPSTTPKCPVTPAQPGKVNAGSCGRGRGILLGMGSTGSPGELTHSGRGETSSRSAQNYSGSSEMPSAGPGTGASGSGTGPRCQSNMSGTNSKVGGAASTTSSSTQTKTEETKAGGGAGRGSKNGTSKSQESSSYFSSGSQVGHPPGEPENYYKLSAEKAPKPCQKKDEDGQKPDVSSTGQPTTTFLNLGGESNQACEPIVIETYSFTGIENGFSSEEENEQRAKQLKKSEGALSYFISFFSRSSK